MAFTKQLPEWQALGVEPPQSLKEGGWKAGVKPAADYFNWLQNKAFKAIEELQLKAGEIKSINGQLPDEKGNIQVDVDTTKLATRQSVTDVSNALIEHQEDGMQHLTNGFLKINNGSKNFLLKMDAEGLYLEEV